MKHLLVALLLAFNFSLAASSTGAAGFEVLKADFSTSISTSASAVDIPAPSYSAPQAQVSASGAATGQLKVYFISVGQGDAAYFELPNGGNALIDGGPKTAYIRDFLTAKGVTHIDNVVLTHPHSDHYSGLKWVFSNTTVSNFYDNQADNAGAQGDNTVRDLAAAQKDCTIVHPRAGDTYTWSVDVGVKVFNSCPDPVSVKKEDDVNGCSIVMKISYGGRSVLMTGDIALEHEAQLVERFGSELKADILKVAHHGSMYASSEVFLNAVQPREAVISVGKNNYGHPQPSALQRLAASGATITRTDISGTVSFTLSGDPSQNPPSPVQETGTSAVAADSVSQIQ